MCQLLPGQDSLLQNSLPQALRLVTGGVRAYACLPCTATPFNGIKRGYAQRRKALRHGHCQPYAVRPQQPRHNEEAGHEQHEAAHHGERKGRPDAFDALEIAYGRKVEDEENEACGEVGEAVNSYARRPVVEAYEQAYEPAGQPRERRHDHKAAHGGRNERGALGLPHARRRPEAEVVADYWLGRLRYGVAHHEDEGRVVARYAERPDAVVAQVTHEHEVAHQYEHGQRGLAQQRRRAYAALVAYVPRRQPHARAARLQRRQAQRLGVAQDVDYGYQAARGGGYRRGEGRPHDAPSQRKHEQPVEHYVEGRRREAARHGHLGCAVEPDYEQRHGLPHHEHPRRHVPHDVVAHQRQQVFRRAEQPCGLVGETQQQRDGHRRGHRCEEERLRDVEPGRLGLAARQVD